MPIYDSSRNKEPPISNHAVHDRATARSLERHHQRLRTIAQQNIRPYNVGDGWSHSKPRYEHLTHNLKRAQLEGERYADISRDNQNLLRKIALMEQSAVLDPTEGTWEFAPGVRLNRFQVPVIDHCISLQPQMRGAAKVPESLNRGARKRELERITRENLGIVQRIQNCPPSEQTRLDALRAHAAKNERIRHRIRQPKLGLGFHSPSPSPSAETRLATPQLRGATAPAPSQMPRRVFTPAQVFAPFERRGEPVPSALLRDAAEGATELLVVRDHATAAPSLATPSLNHPPHRRRRRLERLASTTASSRPQHHRASARTARLLLVAPQGVASGFVPGSMALVDDQHVPISSASLCREARAPSP